MTLFTADQVVSHKAEAREVFDVSGAGDTVIATLGAMLGSGADWVYPMPDGRSLIHRWQVPRGIGGN